MTIQTRYLDRDIRLLTETLGEVQGLNDFSHYANDAEKLFAELSGREGAEERAKAAVALLKEALQILDDIENETARDAA